MQERLDTLSRQLAATTSRRGALKLIAGTAGLALLPAFMRPAGALAQTPPGPCTSAGMTPCGGGCCNAGVACVNGQCGCPSGTTTCGTNCCPAGVACRGGSTCGCPSGTTTCGSQCCAPGTACIGNRCGCSAGGQQCGTFTIFGQPNGPVCCKAGEACSRPGCMCCPSGTTPCGLKCCQAGTACKDRANSICGGPVAACLQCTETKECTGTGCGSTCNNGCCE